MIIPEAVGFGAEKINNIRKYNRTKYLHYLALMLKRLLANEMLRFVTGFLVIYGCLFMLNYIWTGFTIPGGYYCSWLDHNADYISGLRKIILHGASAFLSLLGYENEVYGYYLHIIGGKTIRMVYSCIGLNIICVWWAFNLSFPLVWKSRLVHIIAGTIIITILNIIRIAFVALSPHKGKFLNSPFDHHTVFNFVVYGIIILMIFRIINRHNQQ